MTDSDVHKAAQQTMLGRRQFVLRYGVLGWGLPTAFLFCLIQGFFYGREAFVAQLIPAFILFPIGGIFFGRYLWWMLAKKHAGTNSASAAK